MLLARALVPAAVAMSLGLGLAAEPAAADVAGDRRLAAIDDATAPDSMYYELKAVTRKAGSSARRIAKLQLWMKGERRLLKFTAPADLKGTKVLVDGTGRIYVYQPGDRAARELVAAANDAGVVGLAYAAADLAAQQWSGRYTARQLRAGDASRPATLVLTPREGIRGGWPKVEMDVSLDDVPLEVRYFAGARDREPARVEKRYHHCDDDGCTWTSRVLVVGDGERTTSLETQSVRLGAPCADTLFTPRTLAQ